MSSLDSDNLLLNRLSACENEMNSVLYQALEHGYEISINTTIVELNSPRSYRHPVIEIHATNQYANQV